jgi:hypothetical protein
LAKEVVRWSGDNDGSGWLIIRSGAALKNAALADSKIATFGKPENVSTNIITITQKPLIFNYLKKTVKVLKANSNRSA